MELVDVKANSRLAVKCLLKGDRVLIEGKALNTVLRSLEPLGLHENFIITGFHNTETPYYDICRMEKVAMDNTIINFNEDTFTKYMLENINASLTSENKWVRDRGDTGVSIYSLSNAPEDEEKDFPYVSAFLTEEDDKKFIEFIVSSVDGAWGSSYVMEDFNRKSIIKLSKFIIGQDSINAVLGFFAALDDVEFSPERTF